MRARNIIALVAGSLIAIPAAAAILGSASLAIATAVERNDDGFFDITLDRLETDAPALVSDDITLEADSEAPWLIDALDADVRLRVSAADTRDEVFIGIAREGDVDDYLDGVARTDVAGLEGGRTPELRHVAGADEVAAPTDQGFWVTSAAGSGTQEIVWEARNGAWSVVVMNADARPDLAVDVTAGVRSGLVIPLAIGLLVAGVLLLVLAVTLIVVGARAGVAAPAEGDALDRPVGGPRPFPPPVPPGTAGAATPPTGRPPAPTAAASRPTDHPVHPEHPVHYSAALEDDLSRWMWLVKWVLAIPHFIVLVFLWIAFVALTIAAWFAIVVTGRYPRSIFDINVGILRWTWRVSHYAATGGLGTDRYPPFGFEPQADDPVRLDVEYPTQLSRGLPFVKVILAIPHLIVVGLLAGSSIRWFGLGGIGDDIVGGGLLGVFVLFAGVALLFTGSYPAPLYDLIAGLNRWILRVVAYVALMTDEYPPFRLDQGPDDPSSTGPTPPDTPQGLGIDVDRPETAVESPDDETASSREPSWT